MSSEDCGGRPLSTPAAARQVMRSALKASLATREAVSGFPYASLVTVGFRPDGTPVLLLSRLAVHTRNLELDQRASLLFDATDGAADPLAGGRVTVVGRIKQIADGAAVRGRFLARHPGAEMYADFPDFAFWQLNVERAHYIGGFGQIVDLTASELLGDVSGAEELIAAEADIVSHMNEDHRDAVQLYATRLARVGGGDWRMTGIDPNGIDLGNGERGAWLAFEQRITNREAARVALVAMAQAARGAAG